MNGTYSLSITVPRQIFNDDYPVNPKTFGERVRKDRRNAGLQIKELAVMVGVSENTILQGH